MHVKERVKLMGVGGDIPVVPQRTLFFCDPGSPSTPKGQGKFPCRRGSFLAARVTAAVDRLGGIWQFPDVESISKLAEDH